MDSWINNYANGYMRLLSSLFAAEEFKRKKSRKLKNIKKLNNNGKSEKGAAV